MTLFNKGMRETIAIISLNDHNNHITHFKQDDSNIGSLLFLHQYDDW